MVTVILEYNRDVHQCPILSKSSWKLCWKKMRKGRWCRFTSRLPHYALIHVQMKGFGRILAFANVSLEVHEKPWQFLTVLWSSMGFILENWNCLWGYLEICWSCRFTIDNTKLKYQCSTNMGTEGQKGKEVT